MALIAHVNSRRVSEADGSVTAKKARHLSRGVLLTKSQVLDCLYELRQFDEIKAKQRCQDNAPH